MTGATLPATDHPSGRDVGELDEPINTFDLATAGIADAR